MGALEVKDSRGISHCEEAVKRHKQRKERNKRRALLCISPETIRLVKEKNKQLIIDQTIEKVSFCAPDSNYEKAFSYICREGTTKRWMCHRYGLTDRGTSTGFNGILFKFYGKWRRNGGATVSRGRNSFQSLFRKEKRN